ncbi:MAG: hypothetical protein H6Q01_752, partial [Acidobacteria bacterium]|nr:hypothetical protein [Acidobacteriota bacterium]
MSAVILIDWYGAGARARWHVQLRGLPARAVRPAGLVVDPAVGGDGDARMGEGIDIRMGEGVDARMGNNVGVRPRDDARPEDAGRGRGSDAVVRFPAPPARLLRLDRLAVELRVAHDRLALPLARAAAAFLAAKAWRPCGAARLEDHARERFGRTARWVRQWADLGDALARFPDLAPALTGDDGGVPLGAEAARLVARVVAAGQPAGGDAAGGDAVDGGCDAPEGRAAGLLARWVARAREVPLRILRAEVRAALAGDAGDAGVAVDIDADGAVEDEAEGAAGGRFPKVAANAGRFAGDPDLDDEPRCVVEFRLPAAIRAAFEEVVDLHRALAGRDG